MNHIRYLWLRYDECSVQQDFSQFFPHRAHGYISVSNPSENRPKAWYHQHRISQMGLSSYFGTHCFLFYKYFPTAVQMLKNCKRGKGNVLKSSSFPFVVVRCSFWNWVYSRRQNVTLVTWNLISFVDLPQESTNM